LRDPPGLAIFPPMETAESLAASLDLNSIGWRTVTVIPITLEEKNRFRPARRYHNLSGALVIIRDEANSNPIRNTSSTKRKQHKFDGSEGLANVSAEPQSDTIGGARDDREALARARSVNGMIARLGGPRFTLPVALTHCTITLANNSKACLS